MVTTIASTNRLYIASRNSSQRRPYGYRRVSAFHNRQRHLVYVKIVIVNYFSLYVNAACIRTIAVFYLSYMTLGSRRKIALDTQPSYRYLINIGSNIVIRIGCLKENMSVFRCILVSVRLCII